jgi:hypothetical protein
MYVTAKRAGVMLGAALLLSGCESSDSPTGVQDPTFAVGDLVLEREAVRPGVSIVCVFQPYPHGYGPSTFSASADGGDLITGDFQVEYPCLEIWNATDDQPTELTVSLSDFPDNLELEAVVTLVGTTPDISIYQDGRTSATVNLSDAIGGNIWFKFKLAETPPSGGEGCTPGYWRQEHHFDSWTGYAPTDLFSSVFADAFPGQTLLDVVWARGGGVNALGRHAVAALLNTSSAGVDYDYTTAQVVERFNAAFATGSKSEMNTQKDLFDFLNNQGCGLN